MKKTIPIPIYILLLAILFVFVLQWREARALRVELKAELVGIRNEQLKQPFGGPPLPPGAGIPVYVTNPTLDVAIKR
jgi:hypothetical protein